MRRWVFSAESRSAVRLSNWDIAQIVANPDSTVPLAAARVRNSALRMGEDEPVVGGLFVEASGDFNSPEEAFNLLGNIVRGYLSIAAVAGNGAVDEPRRILIYAPPAGESPGKFIQQRNEQELQVPLKLRNISAEDLVPLLCALVGSPRQEIMYRAMAHYRIALGHIDRLNVLSAAESLFVACETLGRSIYGRLAEELDGIEQKDTKHRLALAAGFSPPSTGSREHLYAYDSYVRLHWIFEGDGTTYQALKELNGVEHGYMSFGAAQEIADRVTAPAFRLIRRAILREMGVPTNSALFQPNFDAAIGIWGPEIEIVGSYTDTDTLTDLVWPAFAGAEIGISVESIVEREDGLRDVRFKLLGSASLLSPTQKGSIHRVTLVAPGITEVVEGERLRDAASLQVVDDKAL